MAIRFTFHWGPDADFDRQQAPFNDMASIWYAGNMIAAIEKHKHAGEYPAVAVVNMDLNRDLGTYTMLNVLFQISRMRMDDPTYELPCVYLPTSIQELHLFCRAGEELPWDRSRPTKSKVWRQTAPEWFEGVPYSVVYHGSEPEPSSNKRRSKYMKIMYKPKYFKPKDVCVCRDINCDGSCDTSHDIECTQCK